MGLLSARGQTQPMPDLTVVGTLKPLGPAEQVGRPLVHG